MNIGFSKRGKVCGVGFCTTNLTSKVDGKTTKCYTAWKCMIHRAYSKNRHHTQPTYKDVVVCDEWLDYYNFHKWFHENYYEIGSERMELDKDLIVNGNKCYSPDTCAFVPQSINSLLIDNKALRGDYPVGVYYHKIPDNYVAQIRIDGKQHYIGSFTNCTDASSAYQIEKKSNIKRMANKYKPLLPPKIYDSLLERAL